MDKRREKKIDNHSSISYHLQKHKEAIMYEELKGELQELLEAYYHKLHETKEEHTIKLQNLVYSMRSFLHTHDTLQVITNKHDNLLEKMSRLPHKENTDE